MNDQLTKDLNTNLKQINNSSESLENTLKNLVKLFKSMSNDSNNLMLSQGISLERIQNSFMNILGTLNDSNMFETLVESSTQFINMLDTVITKIDIIQQGQSSSNNVGREKYSVIPFEICRQ